ncbi:MAG: flagellar M-ring protein FliF, partial [Alphaproteobacteria bacterium]|nr:flagellar M-ring protein FliF [Alphaproteobacteria bacterium]
PARLAIMGIVAVGLVAFFMFMASRLGTSDMALLYGDLAVEDASAITQRLESQNIPFELRGNGSQIFVPSENVDRLRMSMAADGLPNGGSIGYELFDQSDAIGTTNFVQRINHVRALEGELSRTIGALSQVQSARVHLVLPRRELFTRDRQEPSASVVLKLRGSAIQSGQIAAIQNLVASAVPGLTPDRISVVDHTGRLHARGDGGDGDALGAGNAEEARQRFEGRIARSVEKLLESTVGIGGVRAEVAADIDFDRLTTTNETYDPDGQVVRSTQTVEQEDASSEAQKNDSVSIANNLPNTAALDGAGDNRNTNNSRRSEETVNFEISRKVTTLVRETGQVNRITVAVLVDGTYDAEGNYTPRTAEQLEQYAALVKSSIGFNEERGDVVEIVNQQFAQPDIGDAPLAEAGILGFGKADILKIAELLVLAIVSVLVILLVVRPIMSRALEAAAAAPANDETALLAAGAEQMQLAPPSGEYEEMGRDPDMDSIPEDFEDENAEIDIANIDGKVKKSSLSQINQIVDKHPDETISIMRGWMYQDA